MVNWPSSVVSSAADAVLILDRGQQRGCTLDVAGCTVANPEHVPPAALEIELRVEGGDTVDFAQGDVEPIGDALQDLDGQVAVDGLGALQDGDQGAFFALVFGEDLVQEREVERISAG